ncbi:uncharacterized protein METZ01_LOCUS370444, partial [marine metagenome]
VLSRLIDVSDWSAEQWLAALILGFITMATLLILHRFVKLFRMSQKPSHKPNLRPLRSARHRNPKD